jgi:hypothetical protein
MEGIQPQNQMFLAQKHAEKLLQLGPVIGRIHGEFLDKMIDRTFGQCLRAGLLPPAPPELQGRPLKVRYISPLALAQGEVDTQGADRLVGHIRGLMEAGFATAGDNFDPDESVRGYAGGLGTSPRLIRSEDTVAQIRQQREQEQRQQQQMAMAQQMAGAMQQGGAGMASLADAAGAVRGPPQA